MPGISRDRDSAARQLAGLARTNSVLAAKLEAGELPGYKGPLEGTEHLHQGEPPAPQPVMPGTPVEPGSGPAAPDTAPVPGVSPAAPGTRVRVGTYDTSGDHGLTDPPEPEPEPSAGPDAPAAAPAQRRGVFGQLVDGFTGRV